MKGHELCILQYQEGIPTSFNLQDSKSTVIIFSHGKLLSIICDAKRN